MQVGLTVNNQNILSQELEGHSVQLFADILTPEMDQRSTTNSTASILYPPHLLARHNECSSHVSILDESLSVRQVQFLGQVQRSDTRCIRHLGGELEYRRKFR